MGFQPIAPAAFAALERAFVLFYTKLVQGHITLLLVRYVFSDGAFI